MATISAADIKRLREATGAGMTDCKNALVEADGEFEKAVEILRIKGQKGVAKREGRAASNGLVTVKQTAPGKATLLELNCETDFVAKGETFIALAEQVVTAAAAAGANEPKDIVIDGKDLQVVLDDANATLGEKIEVRRVATIEAPFVATYLHKTNPDLPPQLGVVVGLTGENAEVGKDVAQHVAAFTPLYAQRADVPEDAITNERRVAREIALNEGKPEAALEKIVEGRVQGFFKEAVLVEQAFAKDNKKTVGKVLDQAGVGVAGFVRFKVGQA